MNIRSSFFFIALLLPGLPALAQDVQNPAPACHLLMTDQECAGHEATLARLPEGERRDAYLAAHARLLKERAQACACFRDGTGKVRSSVIQHLPARPTTRWF